MIFKSSKEEAAAEGPAFDLPAVKAALEFGMNQHKAFKNAHEVISILESWDNASKNIKKRLDDLNGVYTTTAQQVEDAKAELAMAEKEVADVRALALADAEKIKADAAVEAEAIKAEKLKPLEAEADALQIEIAGLLEGKLAVQSEVAALEEKKGELEVHVARIKAALA